MQPSNLSDFFLESWNSPEHDAPILTNQYPIKASILLVEDDDDQMSYFSALLKRHNFSVIEASSAEIALNILTSKHVDCVVSDLRMPEIDGQEFVKIVRLSSQIAYIPIIVITDSPEDLALELLAQGADMFCTKKKASRDLHEQIRLLLS